MSMRGLYVLLAAAMILCAAAPAAADKAKAEAHYKKGFTAYNLGKFDEAIEEFTAAFEEEPDSEYLYALAGAHRLGTNYERAAFYYRRYLGLNPNASNRPEIEGWIVQLDKAAADKALAEKARLESERIEKERLAKIAADQAEAARITAELKAKESGLNKHVRIAFDVGFSIIYLRGKEDDPRAPTLGGRFAVSWTKRVGSFVVDLGGSWQLATIPYAEVLNDDPMMMETRATNLLFTQLHGTASAMRTIYGPIWARLGIGLGLSAFGNVKKGNPITMDPGGDIRMLCARADSIFGYRYNPTVDFVFGLASGSISAKSKDAPGLGRVVTAEGLYVGLYIKL
jgi:tetratricopeptide (TPR) repeat protein